MKNLSQNKKIIAKALCIFKKEGKILLCKGYDSVKKETFYRIVGGTLNFGEKAEEAIRREIIEELNSEIENLEFITVVENIFTFEGKAGHEICFIYKGDLTNRKIYKKKHIPINDEGFPTEWVSISDILTGKVILYPEFDYQKLFSLWKR